MKVVSKEARCDKEPNCENRETRRRPVQAQSRKNGNNHVPETQSRVRRRILSGTVYFLLHGLEGLPPIHLPPKFQIFPVKIDEVNKE